MFLCAFSKASGSSSLQSDCRSFSTILHIWFHSLNSLFPHTIKTNLAVDISVQSKSSAKPLSKLLQFEVGSLPDRIFHKFPPLPQLRIHHSVWQKSLQCLQHPRSGKRVQIYGQLQQEADRGVITPSSFHASAVQLLAARALAVRNPHAMGMKAVQSYKNITRLYIKEVLQKHRVLFIFFPDASSRIL